MKGFRASGLTRDANGSSRKSNRSTRFPCTNCTCVYSTKRTLMTHRKYECSQPPRFKCPYCDLVSKKKFNVCQHIRRKHKDHVVCVQDIQHPSNPYNTYRVIRQCRVVLQTFV